MGKKKNKKKKVLKVNVDDLSKKDLKEVCKKLMKQNKKLREYLEDFDPKGLREELMGLADKMKKVHKKNGHLRGTISKNWIPHHDDPVRAIFVGDLPDDKPFEVVFTDAFRPFDTFDDCEW